METIKVSLDEKKVVCPNGHLIWDEATVAKHREGWSEFTGGTLWTSNVDCEECGWPYRVELAY